MHRFERYDSLIRYYAHACSLRWRLIRRQIEVESEFDPRAVSRMGAKGLAQFIDSVWREWGEGDPYNPEESIKACCRYMAFLYGRFGEIPSERERYWVSFAAYNTGRPNVNKALALAREACGQPRGFAEWDRLGRPSGPWQTWDYAGPFLRKVTGYHAQETLYYVARIRSWSDGAST